MEETLFKYEMGLARDNLEQLTRMADHLIDLLRRRTESDSDEPPPAEQAAQLLEAADNFLFAAKVLRRQAELPPVTTTVGAIALWLSDHGWSEHYDYDKDDNLLVINYNGRQNAAVIADRGNGV